MESARVRKARALDEVDALVERACGMLREFAESSTNVQKEWSCGIRGAVEEAAEEFGVDDEELMREALGMLHGGIRCTLDGKYEVAYVKPYKEHGKRAGMKAKFYDFGIYDRRKAC